MIYKEFGAAWFVQTLCVIAVATIRIVPEKAATGPEDK
jgi:hypothetical protein